MSTLTDASAKLENMYTSPSTIKPPPIPSNDKIAAANSRYDRGTDMKLTTLPPDVKNMVHRGSYAMAFFVAILSGVGIGMGMFLKYKLCLLLLTIFILIVIVSPEISDYLVYGIGEYTTLGYTHLKTFTNNIFVSITDKARR